VKFGLTRRVLGSSSFLAITESEFNALVSAKAGLLSTLFVEEKFDLLVENYLELENSLLDSTARFMVHRDHDYKSLQVERNQFNRRLVNLLSACRSYVDYAKHYIHVVLATDSSAIAQIETAFSKHYDACLGYRVMEALRNFVQHRGFPIHAISYPSKWQGEGKRSKLMFGLSIFTKTTYLREDERFKESVLKQNRGSQNRGSGLDLGIWEKPGPGESRASGLTECGAGRGARGETDYASPRAFLTWVAPHDIGFDIWVRSAST